MFDSRNSPSKKEQPLTSNNRDYQRMYSNFSPINGGVGGSGLAAGMLNGAHSSTQQDFNQGDSLQFQDRRMDSVIEAATAAKIEKLTLPFKREYEIVFHEQDLFKIQLVATSDQLTLLVMRTGEIKFWKGEYQAEYLEDISRKTGRELSYKEFVELINHALVSQDSNKLKES